MRRLFPVLVLLSILLPGPAVRAGDGPSPKENPCPSLLSRRVWIAGLGAAGLAAAWGAWAYFGRSDREASLDDAFDPFGAPWNADEVPGPPIRLSPAALEAVGKVRLRFVPELHGQPATFARERELEAEAAGGKIALFVEGEHAGPVARRNVYGFEAPAAVLLSSMRHSVNTFLALVDPAGLGRRDLDEDERQVALAYGRLIVESLWRLSTEPAYETLRALVDRKLEAVATNDDRRKMLALFRAARTHGRDEATRDLARLVGLGRGAPRDFLAILVAMADAAVDWAAENDRYVAHYATAKDLKARLREPDGGEDWWNRRVDHGFREYWMGRHLLERAVALGRGDGPRRLEVRVGAAHVPGLVRLLRRSLSRSGGQGDGVEVDESVLAAIERDLAAGGFGRTGVEMLALVRDVRRQIARALREK